MEHEFELLERDYINFNVYHANTSPAVKINILLQRLVGSGIFLLAPFIIKRYSDLPFVFWMSLFSIGAIFWFVFYPKYFNLDMSRKIQKMLREGNNEQIFT